MSENPAHKKAEPLVSDILKTLFQHEGIEFKSVVLIHWRVVEDNVIPKVLNTLGDLCALSRDGNYHIAIKNVKIWDIEKEPIETPEINVEVSLENGRWSEPRIYTDFETCSPDSASPEALSTRLIKIVERLKGTLGLIMIIMRISESLHDLFS